MCNPYVIKNEVELPNELRNIIEDENGYLTTLALKVLVMIDYDDVIYSINSVTALRVQSEFGGLIYDNGAFYHEP
jgi:hypothetical protein